MHRKIYPLLILLLLILTFSSCTKESVELPAISDMPEPSLLLPIETVLPSPKPEPAITPSLQPTPEPVPEPSEQPSPEPTPVPTPVPLPTPSPVIEVINSPEPVKSKPAVAEGLSISLITNAKHHANEKSIVLIKDYLERGIIGVSVNNFGDKRVKFRVEKDGTIYNYDLFNDGRVDYFPLNLGPGEYKLTVFEQTTGTRYTAILRDDVSVSQKSQSLVYLNPIQNINWLTSKSLSGFINQLNITDNMSDEAIVKKTYEYIVKNIDYDNKKAETVTGTYIPNLDQIIKDRIGICYDYSSLFAAVLRCYGIPVKLVKGYTDNVSGYHAWNEVYNKEKNIWQIMDLTVDSYYYRKNISFEMIKNDREYSKKSFEY